MGRLIKSVKTAGIIWIASLIVFGLLLLSPYNNQETPPDFITIIFILDVLVGVVAFCCILIFGFLYATTKNKEINTSVSYAKKAKDKSVDGKSIKLIKESYIKYFVISIFILLLLITYQLYQQNTDTPKTKLDCLKLGSDKRAEACLELLKQDKPQEEFPISYLSTENANATTERSCIKVSGAIKNSYSLPAQFIMIRIDFSKTQDSEPFHYEVFNPFDLEDEQLQPNSKKTFSECLRRQSYNAVKDVQNWYFSVTPYSAKIYKE